MTPKDDPSTAGNPEAPNRAWTHFCELLIEEPILGFRLDVSGMRFGPADLERLEDATQRALAAMAELERGSLANPDEGRRVGHYWLRAPDLAPEAALKAAIRETQAKIATFATRVHSGEIRPPADDGAPAFRNLLLVGIGGSALGPQLVEDALAAANAPLRAFYLDNTDPDGIDRVLNRIGPGLAETLVLVISKSGGTKETRNGMLEVQHALKMRELALGPRAVAVTGAGSSLDRFAREAGFLETFPMWDWVGGRTSVTSAVGLLPAALLGIDTGALLEGARRMDELTRGTEIRGNPAAMMALLWHLAGRGRGERAMVVLPYKDRLILLSRYLQQLVMESLGKELDLEGRQVHQGLSVYGNKGSTDQHAYVQQLREGPDNFFVTFIEVLRDRAGHSIEVEPGVTTGDYLLGFLAGTRQALEEAGRGSMTITIPEVSAITLGALIALFERAVGLYAFLIGINAYHQPGVEAGKRAAAGVLEIQGKILALLGQADAESLTLQEIAGRIDEPGALPVIFRIVEHLVANDRLRVIRSGPAYASRYAAR